MLASGHLLLVWFHIDEEDLCHDETEHTGRCILIRMRLLGRRLRLCMVYCMVAISFQSFSCNSFSFSSFSFFPHLFYQPLLSSFLFFKSQWVFHLLYRGFFADFSSDVGIGLGYSVHLFASHYKKSMIFNTLLHHFQLNQIAKLHLHDYG